MVIARKVLSSQAVEVIPFLYVCVCLCLRVPLD